MTKPAKSPFSFAVHLELGLSVGRLVDWGFVVVMGRRVAGGNLEVEVVVSHGGTQVTICVNDSFD